MTWDVPTKLQSMTCFLCTTLVISVQRYQNLQVMSIIPLYQNIRIAAALCGVTKRSHFLKNIFYTVNIVQIKTERKLDTIDI